MATYYATFDGVIQSLTPTGDGNYNVKLVSGSRTIIYYALSTVNVHPTQQVLAGQLIGSTDAEDNNDGPQTDIIIAPTDGYISDIEKFQDYWIVTFVGIDGKITRYVSLTEVFVARCQALKAGDIIGFKRSGNYIWNQYRRQQPTSNAWISGKFRADGSIGVGVDPQYALHVVSGQAIAGAFDGRVRGVNAVNDDEFITKAQLPVIPAPITFINALEAGGVNTINWGGPLIKNTLISGAEYGIEYTNLAYHYIGGMDNRWIYMDDWAINMVHNQSTYSSEFNIRGGNNYLTTLNGSVGMEFSMYPSQVYFKRINSVDPLDFRLQHLAQSTDTTLRFIAHDSNGMLVSQDRNGFIWNQFTGAQTPADWWISGSGRLNKLWINSSANYGTTRFIAESTANADDVTGYFVNDKTFGNTVNIGLFTAVRVRATTPISQTAQTVIAGARNQISFFNTSAITTHPDTLLGGMAGQVYYGGTGSILGTAKVAGYISDINLSSGAGATITHLAAFYALKPFQAVGQTAFTGSVTNYYGLYLDDAAASNINATIVNRYGVYQAGSTDINRFNGHIDLYGLATGNTTDDILLIDPSTNRVKRITRAAFLVGAGEADKNFAEDNLTADGNRTHAFGAFSSEITYNSIAGFGMKLSSSSTAAAGGNQALLQVNLSGANANSGQTTYGIRVTNDHTGTNPTNYGIHASVTGGNTASAAIRGVITGDGYAIFASSVNGDAVNAGSTSGIGGNFGSSSNTAVQGVSSTGMGALFGTNGNYAIDMYRGALAVGEMTAVAPVIRARRLTSGFTAANGFGQSWEFYTSFNGGGGNSNVLISKWTDAAILTRSSQLIIQGVSNATTADLFTLDGNGQLRLNKYGVGTFTGTVAKYIATTNTGILIEVDPGSIGGGGPDTNFAETDLLADGNRSHDFDAFNLSISDIGTLLMKSVVSTSNFSHLTFDSTYAQLLSETGSTRMAVTTQGAGKGTTVDIMAIETSGNTGSWLEVGVALGIIMGTTADGTQYNATAPYVHVSSSFVQFGNIAQDNTALSLYAVDSGGNLVTRTAASLGGTISEPDMQIVVGTGAGIDSYDRFIYDNANKELHIKNALFKGALVLGEYSSVGALLGGAGFVFGTGMKPSSTANKVVKLNASSDHAHWTLARYDRGISFHTGIGGGVDGPGTEHDDISNERMRIASDGKITIANNVYIGSPTSTQIASGQKLIVENGIMAASVLGHALYFYADWSNNAGAILAYNYASNATLPIYIWTALTVGTWNTAHSRILKAVGDGEVTNNLYVGNMIEVSGSLQLYDNNGTATAIIATQGYSLLFDPGTNGNVTFQMINGAFTVTTSAITESQSIASFKNTHADIGGSFNVGYLNQLDDYAALGTIEGYQIGTATYLSNGSSVVALNGTYGIVIGFDHQLEATNPNAMYIHASDGKIPMILKKSGDFRFNYRIGVQGVADAKVDIYDTAVADANLSLIQSDVTYAGLGLAGNYGLNAYFGAISWHTVGQEDGKPKVMMAAQTTNSGSKWYLWTSNNYATGAAITALTADYNADVTIGRYLIADAPTYSSGGYDVIARNQTTGRFEKVTIAGGGDMTKAVYDTDDDGKVNSAVNADAVPWTGVSGKPATFPADAHNHDDRYYTDTEIDSMLTGYAASSHTHDDRYYTETEINTMLTGYAASSHTHDDRYYTETEVDNLLSSKQATLVSATNIKTINGSSILGSGNLTVSATNPVVIRKTADTSNSSNTTLQNATDLAVPVDANSYYAIDFYVIFQAAAATTGIAFAINGPAGATITMQASVPISTTGGNVLSARALATASAASSAVDTLNANVLALVSVIVSTGGTAGTIQLQFRSEVNSSAVTIKQNSLVVSNKLV